MSDDAMRHMMAAHNYNTLRAELAAEREANEALRLTIKAETDLQGQLQAELAAERERLDFIETYVKARAEEHEFLAGMAGGALSGKKQRVRAHEASTILGRIREVRK